MKIKVWRIVKEKHASDAFSGQGAYDNGGRWNFEGSYMVYTAASISLAVLEILVNGLDVAFANRYMQIYAEIDRADIEELKHLPSGWDCQPASNVTKIIGSDWINNEKSPVLRVPSVVVKEEFNYLINPMHPNVSRIKLGKPEKISIDPRLIKGVL